MTDTAMNQASNLKPAATMSGASPEAFVAPVAATTPPADPTPGAGSTPSVGTTPRAGDATSMHYREAYEKILPVVMALPAEELIPINIDVPSALATALGSLPRIQAFRAQAAGMPGFDASVFDQLETYMMATGHAHAEYIAASAPPHALLKINDEGIALRDLLYSDAAALVKRGRLGGEKLGDFKNNTGYKNLAFDLLGLASMLRKDWTKIESKTAVTLDELNRAETLGEQLMNAVGTREQSPVVAAEVALQRQRTFSLFLKAYDQVRRAITFVRWDADDVDSIAPSLYAGRVRRKSEVPQPPPPPPAGSGSPGSEASAGGAPGTTPLAPHATPASSAPAVGLPGSSPFIVS